MLPGRPSCIYVHLLEQRAALALTSSARCTSQGLSSRRGLGEGGDGLSASDMRARCLTTERRGRLRCPVPTPFSLRGDDGARGPGAACSELKLEHRVRGDDWVWDTGGGRAGRGPQRHSQLLPGPRTEDRGSRCGILVTAICLVSIPRTFPEAPLSFRARSSPGPPALSAFGSPLALTPALGEREEPSCT